MDTVREMVTTHPRGQQTNLDAYVACIESCIACAQSCTACADACLGETSVAHLVRCIRLNLDCADICGVTGRMLSRQTEPEWLLNRLQLEACARACQVCGDECAQHSSMHEHCRVCADACRECQQACERLLETLAVQA